MASDSSPVGPTSEDGNTYVGPKSHFQKTVNLMDWCLVKAETDPGKRRLAVSGTVFEEYRAKRIFTSAPILTRYDVFTLETTDGICICLKGLIDKAGTIENGFPSEVFEHFLFGFPPFWEECTGKYLDEGSSSKNVPEDDGVCEKLSLVSPMISSKGNSSKTFLDQSNKFASKNSYLDSSKNSLDLVQTSKGSKDETSKCLLTSIECVSESGAPDKRPGEGELIDETPRTSERPENHRSDVMRPLKPSRSEVNSAISTLINNVGDPQNDDTGGDHVSKTTEHREARNSLHAGHLRKRIRCKVALDNQSKNILGEEFSNETNSGTNLISSMEIPRHTGGRRVTRLRSKKDVMDDRTSSRIWGDEKFRSKSGDAVDSSGVECDLGNAEYKLVGRNNLSFTASRFEEPKEYKNLSKSDTGSLQDMFEKNADTIKKDKDQSWDKGRASYRKEKTRGKKSATGPFLDNTKEKNAVAGKSSISRSGQTTGRKARRKLAYETPEKEKEEAESGSPQSFSFKRSRSGRLLLPKLEFWRNQTAIYDVDHNITGIGDALDRQQPDRECHRGSRSEPPTLKRQRQ